MPLYELHMRQMSILDWNGIHACSESLPSPVLIVCWKMWMRVESWMNLLPPTPSISPHSCWGFHSLCDVWLAHTQQLRAPQIHTLTHMCTYEHVWVFSLSLTSLTYLLHSQEAPCTAWGQKYIKTERAKTFQNILVKIKVLHFFTAIFLVKFG